MHRQWFFNYLDWLARSLEKYLPSSLQTELTLTFETDKDIVGIQDLIF